MLWVVDIGWVVVCIDVDVEKGEVRSEASTSGQMRCLRVCQFRRKLLIGGRACRASTG